MKITIYGATHIEDLEIAQGYARDYILCGYVNKKEREFKRNCVVYTPKNKRAVYVWGGIKHIRVEFEQWSDFEARKAMRNEA